MTRTERVSDLLAVTSRLIACMEREIELLRTMRPQDIAALQPDKTALAEAYEAHLRALNAPDAEADEAVTPDLRDELIRATEHLQRVLAENARALSAVRAANDRVLKAIVEALEQRRDRPAAYTASGAGIGRPASAAPVCMTVDRRL